MFIWSDPHHGISSDPHHGISSDPHHGISSNPHQHFQVRAYFKENKGNDMKAAQAAWMASEERAAFMAGRAGVQK